MSRAPVDRQSRLEEFARRPNEQEANQRGLITDLESAAIEAHVLKALNLTPELRVLEAGCGTGLLASAIAGRVAHVVAGDIAFGFCQRARDKLEGRPGASICQSDARCLPFADNVFDRVLLYSVVLYLNEREFKAALGEFRRILRPTGWAFVGDVCNPYRYYHLCRSIRGLGRAASAAEWLKYVLRVSTYYVLSASPGHGWYTPGYFRRLAESAGFEAEILSQEPDMPYQVWRYDAVLWPVS